MPFGRVRGAVGRVRGAVGRVRGAAGRVRVRLALRRASASALLGMTSCVRRAACVLAIAPYQWHSRLDSAS